MKADRKTILIIIVAIIDCVLGGVILYSKKRPDDTLIKTAETGAHFLGQRL